MQVIDVEGWSTVCAVYPLHTSRKRACNEIGLRTGRDSWTSTELYILYETRCLSAQYSFRVSRVTASQVKLRTLQSAIAGRVTTQAPGVIDMCPTRYDVGLQVECNSLELTMPISSINSIELLALRDFARIEGPLLRRPCTATCKPVCFEHSSKVAGSIAPVAHVKEELVLEFNGIPS